jgi:ABC-type antimicrobial peptide transport system permease subunit
MSSEARQHGIERQIVLPLSKAVEIAWKSIRLRLSRSLLVTSGIVLALAFLVSILASDAVVEGMRQWIAHADESEEFARLRERRATLETEIAPLRRDLREAARTAPAPSKDAAPLDEKSVIGFSLDELPNRVTQTPAPVADLRKLLTSKPDVLPLFKQWLEKAEALHAVREELNAPANLAALMEQQGVPTKPEEIESAKIQNRWLLGLALLVAFVGILNAMLMSVTERFREIGTMKCLGALDSFIVKLFLIESLFQGVVGTVLGVTLGLALSILLAAVTYGHYAFANLPWGQVLLSVVVSVIVGVGLTVAGAVYPAWQAARMHPVEAMRVEA